LVLLDKIKDTKDDGTFFVGLNVISIWRIKMVFGYINIVRNMSSKNAILLYCKQYFKPYVADIK